MKSAPCAGGMELIDRAKWFAQSTAIVVDAHFYTYCDLLDASAAVASRLLSSEFDLNEGRVCFLVPPGFN